MFTKQQKFELPAQCWLAGFVLLGALLALVGPMAVVWHFTDADPRSVGLLFLSLNAGYVGAAFLSSRSIRFVGLRTLALAGCVAAVAALVALANVPPPAPDWCRIASLAGVGVAAGALATAVLHGLEGMYRGNMAATVNRSGFLFGIGSCLTAATAGAAYYANMQALAGGVLAVIPVVYFGILLRAPGAATVHRPGRPMTHASVRLVATILFSLLVFFQFGNEWAIAGWLPLFLIRGLGSSPLAAIFALAAYYLCLLGGRWFAQNLIAVVSHRVLLLISMSVAMCGYLLLALAGSLSTAFTALVILGFSFGPIYPLLAENLDNRFHYQPGFYTSLLSVAITGAMTVPWLLGYLCAAFGIKAVVVIPALGSIAVCVLAFLLRLEAHLMREPAATSRGELLY